MSDLPTPQPGEISNKALAQAKSRIASITGLAWLALVYSWVLGHVRLSPVFPWANWHTVGHLVKDVSFESTCLFQALLHIPCVFCGMTRSFVLIGQGRYFASLDYHLLGGPVYLVVLFFAFVAPFFSLQTDTGLRRLTARPVLVMMGVLLMACWLWKLSHSPRFWYPETIA